MKFSPRRDLWLSIVIWSSILVLLISGLSPFFQRRSGNHWWNFNLSSLLFNGWLFSLAMDCDILRAK